MTKQESIEYISSLINDPGSVSEGDQSSIAVFRQKYPYFIPMRYLIALESHKKAPWSPAMLSHIEPYIGNWILFCSFLEAGAVNAPAEQYEGSRAPGNAPIETGADDGNVEEPVEAEARDIQSEDEIIVEKPTTNPDQLSEISVAIDDDSADFEAEIDQDVAIVEDILTYEPEQDDDLAFIPATESNPYSAPEPATAGTAPEDRAAETESADEAPVKEEVTTATAEQPHEETDYEPLIVPIHSQDYFLHQGERVPEDIPEELGGLTYEKDHDDEAKSLMVMMSFSEWLLHFKNSTQKQQEELKDRKALRTMWQKEKLAAAIEEENEEIPENVFEMAVNSISNEDGLVSETLADVYIKQGKYDKAIEVYRKLSLRNPEKNVYFARKIDEILKDKQL